MQIDCAGGGQSSAHHSQHRGVRWCCPFHFWQRMLIANTSVVTVTLAHATCMARAVVERELSSLPYPNLQIIIGQVKSLTPAERTLALKGGQSINYDRLCLCTGASPKV